MKSIKCFEFYNDDDILNSLLNQLELSSELSGYRESHTSLKTQFDQISWFDLGDFARFTYIFLLSPLNALEKITIIHKNMSVNEYEIEGDKIVKTLKNVVKSRKL